MPKLQDWIARAEQADRIPVHTTAETEAAGTPPQAGVELQQIAQLQKAYANRVAAHGKRLFRHPDGKLQEVKPDASPYTVVTRRKWREVVQHCQVSTSDQGNVTRGKPWRCGTDVSPEEHALLLKAIDLLPESAEYVEGKEDPLADSDHCFNTFAHHTQLK